MKKRKSTFAGRLTRRIVLTLFITMSGVALLIYTFSLIVVVLNKEEYYESVLQKENEYVRRFISDVYVAANNSQIAVEAALDQPDKLMPLTERIVKKNVRVRSCGISFVPGYYPRKGRLFMPYSEEQDDSTIVTRDQGLEWRNYLEEDWFKETLQADSGYWSKPFFDSTDGSTPLMAYMMPIRNRKDSVVAVLGVDMSLIELRERLMNSDKKANADKGKRRQIYSFIIDKSGTYIAHPDSTFILKENFFEQAKGDTILLEVGRKMVNGSKGLIESTNDYDDIVINGRSVELFYSPVKHTDWVVVSVVPRFAIYLEGYVLGGLLLIFIIVGLLVVFLVNYFSVRKLVRPLKHLTHSAGEVAKGHFYTPLPTIKSNDEIRRLRDSFENMQQELTKYVSDLQTVTAQKASIERELSIAHDIQMGMIPKLYPPYPNRNDIDIYGSLTPAKSVGGDLFDFFIRDEKLFFCIGDVSGKGVPASLVMAVTCSLFRIVAANESKPEIIVGKLNDAIAQDNDNNMFVTLFVGILHLSTGVMDYCNAGHDSPLLVGSGVGMLPCESNLPIGVVADWNYVAQQTVVYSNTTILLYTDGLTEAEDAAHRQFGEEQILSVATAQLEKQQYEPQQLIGALTNAVARFVGDAEQSDDLTMLAIQYFKEKES